jgi:hypothetical protein
MEFETIHFESGNGIARLVLNRPEKLNAFNVLMHREVAAALDAVEADESLRVLLLAGRGRGFCAGQDLSERNVDGGPLDLGATTRTYYNPLMRRLASLKIPTLCAVGGVAAGAGVKPGARLRHCRGPSRRQVRPGILQHWTRARCGRHLLVAPNDWSSSRSRVHTARPFSVRPASRNMGTDLEGDRRRSFRAGSRGASDSARGRGNPQSPCGEIRDSSGCSQYTRATTRARERLAVRVRSHSGLQGRRHGIQGTTPTPLYGPLGGMQWVGRAELASAVADARPDAPGAMGTM